MCTVLGKVARKEGLQLPDDLAQRIAVTSERNVRRAILMLETCRVHQYGARVCLRHVGSGG